MYYTNHKKMDEKVQLSEATQKQLDMIEHHNELSAISLHATTGKIPGSKIRIPEHNRDRSNMIDPIDGLMSTFKPHEKIIKD
jgi:hypothetical protein